VSRGKPHDCRAVLDELQEEHWPPALEPGFQRLRELTAQYRFADAGRQLMALLQALKELETP